MAGDLGFIELLRCSRRVGCCMHGREKNWGRRFQTWFWEPRDRVGLVLSVVI